ncbi:MAG TPA: FKBP-type peptidyl-prolyl cis-trans isomerase [Solirubrobacterales bacterium]|jgi:peptidylprolyl isomerase
MRCATLIGACLTALALAACGGSGSTNTTKGSAAGSQSARKPAEPIADSAKPPKVRVPQGPPPGRLVVNDIRQGAGAAIPPKASVKISAHYIGVSYGTGKPFEVRWSRAQPFDIEFGPGQEVKGWEKGLVGMRAGGRRELIVPSKMAYGNGALIYVIDLLAVG